MPDRDRPHPFAHLAGWLCVLTSFALLTAGRAQAQAVRESTWVTNGSVTQFSSSNTSYYLGGDFTTAGAWTGGGVLADSSGGPGAGAQPLRVVGTVYATAPDGAGGWFLGGAFTQVLSRPRANLAHVLADGSLDTAWNPGTDGTVFTMVLQGGVLYVGGSFTTLGGQPRTRLGAMDPSTATVLSWDPAPDATVRVMSATSSRLVVGGTFRAIDGHAASAVASFDLPGLAWSAVQPLGPLPSQSILALAQSGSMLYMGGAFNFIGSPRRGLARLQSSGAGAATSDAYEVVGTVKAIAPDGAGGWYIGGGFSSVKGQPRQNLAHLLADGSLDAWNPGASDTVRAIAVSPTAVYVGGDFTTAGAQTRTRLAAFSTTSGGLLPWAPSADRAVYALVLQGSTVFVGGGFLKISGIPRDGLAALDGTTGSLATVQPAGVQGGSGRVYALALSAGNLYVGGDFITVSTMIPGFVTFDSNTGVAGAGQFGADGTVMAVTPDGAGGWFFGGFFTSVRGQPRGGLAHLLANGTLDPWDPGLDGFVECLRLAGNTLYVGGGFFTAGGQPRASLAAFDVVSHTLLPFAPAMGNPATVLCTELAGDTLYVGGFFKTVSSQPRTGLAAVNAVTGALLGWDPQPAYSTSPDFVSVSGMVLAGDAVHVAGQFDSIHGSTRFRIAALDRVTGLPTGWLSQSNLFGSASLAVMGDTLIMGGDFTIAQGAARNGLAAFSRLTGAVLPWNPGNGPAHSVSVLGGTVYVGGSFASLSGQARRNLGAFDRNGLVLTAWAPQVNGTVQAIASAGGKVACGGAFTGINPVTRNHLAAFVAASGATYAFHPDLNGPVFAIAANGSTAYFGGSFTTQGGSARNRMGAQDLGLGRLPWLPNRLAGTVRSMQIQGNTVYASSEFLGFATPGNALAAFDATTGLATSWDPGPNGTVHAIAFNGSDVMVGGGFTAIGGAARSNFAAFNLANGEVHSLKAEFEREVRAITTRAGKVYVGGLFQFISSTPRFQAAALDSVSGALLPWAPFNSGPFGTTVNAMQATDAGVYLGGQGAALSLVDATTAATLWASSQNGSVERVEVAGGKLFAGGAFSAVRMLPRQGLAAFDRASHALLPASITTNGTVSAVLVDHDRVHVGGTFTLVNGLLRQRYVALDTTLTTVLSPDLALSGQPIAMGLSGRKLYMVGSFTDFGATPRNRAAAIDADQFTLLPWNPNISGLANSFALANDGLFLGGQFNSVGGTSRPFVAKVDTVSGALLPWNALANGAVNALAYSDGVLHTGGAFSSIGGQARPFLAALDPSTAVALPWNPAPNAAVTALAADHGLVFAGGPFTTLAGTHARPGFAALDATTGVPTAWSPAPARGPSQPVTVSFIVPDGSELWIGGNFSTVAGQTRQSFAAFANPAYAPVVVGIEPRPRITSFALSQNAPNPFRGSTAIRFALPTAGRVSAQVLDVNGRLVRTLADGQTFAVGEHTLVLRGEGLKPGLYWYRVSYNGTALTKRMVAIP